MVVKEEPSNYKVKAVDAGEHNNQNAELGQEAEKQAENDPIIEILSAEKWEETLGIPKTASF